MYSAMLYDDSVMTLFEVIDKKLLINQYKKLTGVDFSYLIKVDLDYCECSICKLRLLSH